MVLYHLCRMMGDNHVTGHLDAHHHLCNLSFSSAFAIIEAYFRKISSDLFMFQ
jgi:hypothetical protein